MSISQLRAQDYNPDILNTLANLSNDEVFTPPEVANQVLDLLPQDLFRDPNATFLDPATKSGVFLREIARRLMEGLADAIPDEQERRDHIFHHQLYGIAITQLTSLMSRRSLYCSKFPNGRYSVSRFETPEGNIRFKQNEHTFVNGRCAYCGTNESQYGILAEKGLENYAYEFIHIVKPEEIFGMKFDVIVGNPPYQLTTAGEDNGAQAKPIYHKFVEMAVKLEPRFLCMIIPARWYAGGWGLDDFREYMISCRKISKMYDYINSYDCFPSLGQYKIKGGICVFLWERDYIGSTHIIQYESGNKQNVSNREMKMPGSDIFIRFSGAVDILKKVMNKFEPSFSTIVSTKKPFGMITNYRGKANVFPSAVKLYGYGRIEYISIDEVTRNRDIVNRYKLIVPKAVGTGDSKTDHIKPIICEPGACCTETYLLVGPFKDELECKNAQSYINSRFFHFLVSLQKHTQDTMKRVYTFVPLQDFSKPWTDAELYAKYSLSDEEIAFIESMIWPMDDEGDSDA